jgi:hypothetical protein
MNTSYSSLLSQKDLSLWGGVTPHWRRFFGHYGGLVPAVVVLGLLWLFTDIWFFDRESIMTSQVIVHIFLTLTLTVLMSLVSTYIQKRWLCQMRLIRIPTLPRSQLQQSQRERY